MCGDDELPRVHLELDLPRYAWHLGKAVHALEDDYVHTLRDPVTSHVRSVVNWIDDATDAAVPHHARRGIPVFVTWIPPP